MYRFQQTVLITGTSKCFLLLCDSFRQNMEFQIKLLLLLICMTKRPKQWKPKLNVFAANSRSLTNMFALVPTMHQQVFGGLKRGGDGNLFALMKTKFKIFCTGSVATRTLHTIQWIVQSITSNSLTVKLLSLKFTSIAVNTPYESLV